MLMKLTPVVQEIWPDELDYQLHGSSRHHLHLLTKEIGPVVVAVVVGEVVD